MSLFLHFLHVRRHYFTACPLCNGRTRRPSLRSGAMVSRGSARRALWTWRFGLGKAAWKCLQQKRGDGLGIPTCTSRSNYMYMQEKLHVHAGKTTCTCRSNYMYMPFELHVHLRNSTCTCRRPFMYMEDVLRSIYEYYLCGYGYLHATLNRCSAPQNILSVTPTNVPAPCRAGDRRGTRLDRAHVPSYNLHSPQEHFPNGRMYIYT